MATFLGVILVLVIDCIITMAVLKLIVFILGCLGLTITLSWAKAFGIWIIIKLIRLIWPSGE